MPRLLTRLASALSLNCTPSLSSLTLHASSSPTDSHGPDHSSHVDELMHPDVLAERDYYREVYVPDRRAMAYYHGPTPPNGARHYYYSKGTSLFPGKKHWSFDGQGDSRTSSREGSEAVDLAPEESARGVVAASYVTPEAHGSGDGEGSTGTRRRRGASVLSTESVRSVRDALARHSSRRS